MADEQAFSFLVEVGSEAIIHIIHMWSDWILAAQINPMNQWTPNRFLDKAVHKSCLKNPTKQATEAKKNKFLEVQSRVKSNVSF